MAPMLCLCTQWGAGGSLTFACQGPLINILYICVLNGKRFTNLLKTADLVF